MPNSKNYDLDIDTTLGGSNASDYVIPSQKAIKAYVDNNSGGGGSSTDVQINGTSITSQGVANIITNSAYNATSNKIATMSDLPDDEIFVAIYGTTTNQEMYNAYNTGKLVFCDKLGWLYSPIFISSVGAAFCYTYQNGNLNELLPIISYINCTNDSWSVIENIEVEAIKNKVTSISSASTDTQYPSAKCVWDNCLHSVSYNSSTQTLTIS